MSKQARKQTLRQPANLTDSGVTWADVRKLLVITIIDADRLGDFAGDGEQDFEAPASVRRDPSQLLEWCQRYAPEMVVDDDTAQTSARNRPMSDVVHASRRRDPKRQVTPAHVVAELTGER